jgi:hypothetical protein
VLTPYQEKRAAAVATFRESVMRVGVHMDAYATNGAPIGQACWLFKNGNQEDVVWLTAPGDLDLQIRFALYNTTVEPKWEIEAYPKGEGGLLYQFRNGQRTSEPVRIHVTGTRAPDAIARDIAKRLLPMTEEPLRSLHAMQERDAIYDAKANAIREHLIAAIGGRAMEFNGHGATPAGMYELAEGERKMHVGMGSPSDVDFQWNDTDVSFEASWLPVAVVVEIMQVLAKHGANIRANGK